MNASGVRRGRMIHSADAPSELIDALRRDADALLARGRVIKEGDRTTLARIECDGRPLLLKRFNLRGRLHTAIHATLRSRARWNWFNARHVEGAGLSTPRPIACFEEGRTGTRRRSYLVTEWIEGTPLDQLVRQRSSDHRAIELLARSFAAVFRRLGDHRLGHGDMKASNFMIDETGNVWLIDLDGMRRHPPGPTLTRARARDRTRFLRNFTDLPDAEAIFRAHLDTPGPRAR